MYTHVFRYCRSIDRFNQLGRNPCRSPVRLDRVTCWPPISSPSKVKHTWLMVFGNSWCDFVCQKSHLKGSCLLSWRLV